jgi:hypothetical protein
MTPFESKTSISTRQIGYMSYEIGEILGRLKEKEVFDFKDKVPIILIDRGSSPVSFKKNDLLEVKRFTSLISNYLDALKYLVRNPTFENITKDIERNDRIMGAVNYGRTTALRQRNLTLSNSVVCSEIHRSYETPENRLLALILFSIIMYCDKYLKLEDNLIETTDRHFDPTMEELRRIRSYISSLLSVKIIRQILPSAIDSANDLDGLFNNMLKRIKQGKAPKYFAEVFSLYHRWKYYIIVSSKDEEIAKNVLQYHFMKLKDPNDLYECWIFCKILYAIAQIHNLRFREIRSDRGVEFRADDGSFHIIYQAHYDSGWKDQERPIEDIPDIAIEFKNGTSMVIDAKNSRHTIENSRPNLDQMRLYMKTLNARYGIFIHSQSEDPNLWKEVSSENESQRIIWTSITPGFPSPSNIQNFERTISLVKEQLST